MLTRLQTQTGDPFDDEHSARASGPPRFHPYHPGRVIPFWDPRDITTHGAYHCIIMQTESTKFEVPIAAMISHSIVFKGAFGDRYKPRTDPDAGFGDYISTVDHCGPYMVATSPTVFQHFLNYANTGQYPLFYKEHEGFDYGLYEELYNFAKMYQVPKRPSSPRSLSSRSTSTQCP